MSIWSPDWSVLIDGVQYSNVTVSNLSIQSGRTDLYEQAVAGYLNIELINLDGSPIIARINSGVTVFVKNSLNADVAIFGGTITDLIIGISNSGSIGIAQKIKITALGALSRLPKALTNGVLSKDFDGNQIFSILSQLLLLTWATVPAPTTFQQVSSNQEWSNSTGDYAVLGTGFRWMDQDPATTWATSGNNGLGEIDRPGNYELTSRSSDEIDIYSIAAQLATSGLGYLYEDSLGRVSYADSTHRTTSLSVQGYLELSANDAFSSGLELATRAGDVRNKVTVTYKAGAQVTVQDTNSINLFGQLAQNITTSIENLADAQSQADFYLALRANPQANFNAISFPLGSSEISDSDRDNLLAISMGSAVNILDLPSNMGSNFQGFVEGWQFSAGIKSLTLTMYLTPLAYSLQAMRWNDVPITENWSSVVPTLEWQYATLVA